MLNQSSDMSLSECIAYSGLLCNQLLNVVREQGFCSLVGRDASRLV